MAMRSKVTLKCPKCSQNMEVEQWSAINGDKNPQQKLKLLQGTLFQSACKNCGNPVTVGYPVIYHDTKQNYMIWLVYDDEEVSHVTDYFKKSKSYQTDPNNDDDEKVDPACRQRIVRSADALREKIMIFDSGLDDKIMEIMKLAYAQQAQRNLRSDNIAAAFFTNKDGEKLIELYTEKGKAFVSDVSRDIYRQLEDKYGSKASYAEDRVYLIDDVWAYELLRTMR